jgi:hypothetical protein
MMIARCRKLDGLLILDVKHAGSSPFMLKRRTKMTPRSLSLHMSVTPNERVRLPSRLMAEQGRPKITGPANGMEAIVCDRMRPEMRPPETTIFGISNRRSGKSTANSSRLLLLSIGGQIA